MPTPTDFSFIISVAISGLSHFVRSSKLPRWLNILFTLVAILLIGLVVAWLSPSRTPDLRGMVTQVLLIVASLITGYRELSDLLQYLKDAPSPLAPKSTERQVRASVQDWSKFREND